MEVINAEESIKFIEDFNVSEYVKTFFASKNIDTSGVINTDDFRSSFDILNQKVGIDSKIMGQKEYEWMLNLIHKKSGDNLNLEEAIELYKQMIQIAKDYLYCLQPIDNDAFKLVTKHTFEGDCNKLKSINTLIDLNNNYIYLTIGAAGKLLLNKSDYNVVTYQKDSNSYFISCKTPKCIFTTKESDLFSLNFDFSSLKPVEMNEKHTQWITSIVYLGNNRLATSSGDGTIKIWQIQSDTKLTLIQTLKKHSSSVITIIKTSKSSQLISCGYDNKIIVWNLTNYSILHEIDDVQCLFINGIKELPGQRVAVSGEKELVIVDYMKGEVIKRIPTETKVTCFEIINNYILAGCFDGSYLTIDIDNYDVKTKEEKETNYITSLLKLPKNILVIGLHNGILKVYSY